MRPCMPPTSPMCDDLLHSNQSILPAVTERVTMEGRKKERKNLRNHRWKRDFFFGGGEEGGRGSFICAEEGEEAKNKERKRK